MCAHESPLSSRARLGGRLKEQMKCRILTLLVLMQVYISCWLMMHLCSRLVEPLMAAVLCSIHWFFVGFYFFVCFWVFFLLCFLLFIFKHKYVLNSPQRGTIKIPWQYMQRISLHLEMERLAVKKRWNVFSAYSLKKSLLENK